MGKSVRIIGIALVVTVTLVVGACRGVFGRNSGPIDAFAFLPGSNSQLTEPVQGMINNRPDPKEISLVVPPGTDLSRLVATITLNTEATITVISTGQRVEQTSQTPNNFNVPVTYAIELPGEDEPILYTVRVREASTNARLIDLSIAGSNYQRPTFGPNVTAYEAEVPYATSSVQVTARAEDPNAFAISVNGVRAGTGQATSSVDFSTGDSVEVVVEVVAEDKNTRQEYIITVLRGEPDRNSSLAGISVEGTELDQVFRLDRQAYSAVIPFSADTITVTAPAESEFATVEIGDTPADSAGMATIALDDMAKQSFAIVVTAQDGSQTSYMLTVTRAEPDRNTNLASIAADAGKLSPAFDPQVDTYAVTLDDTQASVVLSVNTDSPLSVVKASSDSTGVNLSSTGVAAEADVTLAEGESSLIVFSVTAEGGDVREYRVVVRRELGMGTLVFTDLHLEGVEISPAFSPEVTEYTASVAADVDSVRLVATRSDPTIEVSIQDEMFVDDPVEMDVLLYEGVTAKTPIRLTAPNGLERVYTIAVSRAETPSRIGRRILEIGMDRLQLPRREAASLNTSRADLETKARIRLRYHGEPEVIFEDVTPFNTERAQSNLLVTMSYRSNFIDLDLGKYVDLEVSVGVSGGRYLTYNTVLFANGDLDVRPQFMFLDDKAEMDWPAPGTIRPVSGRVLYELSADARDRIESLGDGFELNAAGEFETVLKIVDLETGELLGTEILPTKPGSIHGRGIPSIEGIELPEGERVGYVLTARTRDGRLLRDHGVATVRTVETFDNGEWDFASLSIEAELNLVDSTTPATGR